MTENEEKAVRFIENIKNNAVVTLDHIAREEPNVSPLLYKGREEKADTILAMVQELEQYRAIGTVEECRAAVKKREIGKPIYNDKCTCPSCYTHNEVWEKRRNTVGSDIVYCWHCGQAVEIKRISCESEEMDTAEYGKEHPEWAEKVKQMAYKQEE